MDSTRWLSPLGLSLLLAACGSPPTEPEEPLARTDLRAATGQADARPVGVTVAGDGTRFVLDEQAGLYRMGLDGSAQLVLAIGDLPGAAEVRWPLTDIVALGPNLFALTAIGDGFLLDVAERTMARHFCYEPGGFPTDQEQRTNALAFDPATDRLYAQPRTSEDGVLVRSELAMFARPNGADLRWDPLPDDVDAGGLAVLPGADALLLGAGGRLLRFDLATSRLTTVEDLRRFGVTTIDGLTLDAAAQTLLVLDGADDELIELDLAQLTL
jgi:hypothetical protein